MSAFYMTGRVENVGDFFAENTFHGFLSDPPYGLSFMGKEWDHAVPGPDVWRRVLRVLRPGAYGLVFGGTRTFHRLACALEDAGFEIRDVLSWMYGSGFPKSLDVSKAIDGAAGAKREVIGKNPNHRPVSGVNYEGCYSGGNTGAATITAPATEAAREWSGYGTALKPAWEPVILVRKPLEGTVAANVAKWGCGGLAIDACRINAEEVADPVQAPGESWESFEARKLLAGVRRDGRWPANVLLDEDAAAVLDAEVGDRPGNSNKNLFADSRGDTAVFSGERSRGMGGMGRGDSGGPSRFFYTAKVSSKERNAGLDAFPVLSGGDATGREDESDGLNSPRAGAGRGGDNRNPHPTLKPISLATYLARLLLPPTPGASLLVPFAGTGSEMIGARLAGWANVVGVEMDPAYVEIGNARVAHHLKAVK